MHIDAIAPCGAPGAAAIDENPRIGTSAAGPGGAAALTEP